jgi:hypothetical protein
MATYFHERKKLNRGDMVTVECDHECTVRLTDDQNFESYREGKPHRYYGGFYRIRPARIVVPDSGYWNVIVDLGGRKAEAKHQIYYEGRETHAPHR